MLEPSIDSLQKQIDSKYTLVTIAARRARVLQDESNPQEEGYSKLKFVPQALDEIDQGELIMIK